MLSRRNLVLLYTVLDSIVVGAFVYFLWRGVALSKLVLPFGFLFLMNAIVLVILLKMRRG